MKNKVKLFLTDDDPIFLKLMAIEFQGNADFDISTFPTGELCVANLDKKPDVIILDYHLDGIQKNAMNGIATLDEIKKITIEVPVIMLSSQDSIAVAIECMHHKAIDYVIKSETSFVRLKKIISDIYKVKKMENQLNWYMERL